MSDDLVERLAMRLCAAEGLTWEDQYNPMTSGNGDDNTEHYRHSARACFAEIEVAGYAVVPVVPSNAMLIAGSDGTCTNASRSEVARSWSAMIQAARKG